MLRLAHGELAWLFHEPHTRLDDCLIMMQACCRKRMSGAGPSAPKKGLWIGDGLTESDLEDSSDEEEEAGKKVEGKGVSKAVAV